MKNKNAYILTIRKKLIISLLLILIFNLVSLFLWTKLYVNPKIEGYISDSSQKAREIKDEYPTMEELINDLDSKSTKYIIYDLDDNEIYNTAQGKYYLFYSDFINVDGNSYLVKAYLEDKITITDLSWSFLGLQAVLELIIILVLFLASNFGFISPLEKIITDIKNYKYGKKPVRNKIKGEIDVIQNEFVSLTEELDKNNADKNRIIASISHDIKTPLTSILGYSDLINEENDLKKIREYNKKINSKARDIKEITNNFDEYLVNNSLDSLKMEDITVKELVKFLEDDYKTELKLNGISFQVKTTCEKETLKLNVSKMKRVFANLISNSVRYIKNDGKIIIEINKIRNAINFKVSDNGTGVKSDLIDKIFEPFYTTDYSRKITGLGLSIVKEIILYHDGKIKAYNNKLGGLTVEFSIPLKN